MTQILHHYIEIVRGCQHWLSSIIMSGLFFVVTALLLPSSQAWSHSTTSGTWLPVADMSESRGGHEAVLLRSGLVLVIGGIIQNDNAIDSLSSTELFNPRSGSWIPTGSMHDARADFASALIRGGKVLVAGGFKEIRSSVFRLATAELFNTRTGTWHSTGQMKVSRAAHTMTLLRNGKVLVSGGYAEDSPFVHSSAELYDPRTGIWTPTGSMNIARASHTATLLDDGRVLVVGGQGFGALDTAELYNPHTGKWNPAASLNTPRGDHSAVKLRDGTVLVSGGASNTVCCSSFFIDSAERYDPKTDTWRPAGYMNTPRFGHQSIELSTGKVLITGGAGCCMTSPLGEDPVPIPNVEVYDPRTDLWRAQESMSVARLAHTMTLLRSGQVLVTGGVSETGFNASAELFTLAKGRSHYISNRYTSLKGKSKFHNEADKIEGFKTPKYK